MGYSFVMDLGSAFTRHPASIGETYASHFKFAFHVSITLTKAALACLIHAIYPQVLQETASKTIKDLSAQIENRSQQKVDGTMAVEETLVAKKSF